ncbi:hypothetical protein KKH82_08585 [Patescibacteria group bacterium]|nr:hypothetical protein [Patescibacteria group bacterium]
MKNLTLVLVITLLSFSTFIFAQDEKARIICSIQSLQFDPDYGSQSLDIMYNKTNYSFAYYRSESGLVLIGRKSLKRDIALFASVKDVIVMDWVCDGVYFQMVCVTKIRKNTVETSATFYVDGKKSNHYWIPYVYEIPKVVKVILKDKYRDQTPLDQQADL